jgi:tRNA (guanine10-N2)-dimethyltransferase
LTQKSPKHNYIYSFNYNTEYSQLGKLESRQIFGEELTNKFLFSNIAIDPSISPFIKSRFDIALASEDFPELTKNIRNRKIHSEGFKVEYMVLAGDSTAYTERLNKLKDVGYSIEGEPDYYSPTITYAICHYDNCWYFGVLTKHNADWLKHMKKPCSFSNSLPMNIAKTLVGIASKGNKSTQLLDACCGVGTVMLEACIAGFNIEGCDINWKACNHARENLKHYHYTAHIQCSNIKDIEKKYDAIVIDLPYNLYSYSNDTIALNIIETACKLSSRIVIVSISDIEPLIKKTGLKVADFCTVAKEGKSRFIRNIWVCERELI